MTYPTTVYTTDQSAFSGLVNVSAGLGYPVQGLTNDGLLAAVVANLLEASPPDAITVGDIVLAEGNAIVGNAAGRGVELNGKTSGQILVGNGTTLTSVAVSGAGTLSSAGVLAITGAITPASVASAGVISSASPTAGIGYVTGAGGAQTQGTSKATTVVSNTITTAITMHAAQLDAATTVAFTFTNSAIAITDTVLVSHQSAGTNGAYHCNAFPGAGSCSIAVRNITAGNLSEAIVLRVTVIKSVSA